MSQLLEQQISVRNGVYLMKWALNLIIYWLNIPIALYHQSTHVFGRQNTIVD